MAEVITECVCGQLPAGAVYGACGVAGCLRCRPLFDADNKPIPGTDVDSCERCEPCEGCGAEAGEECRPMCTGRAAHLDALDPDPCPNCGPATNPDCFVECVCACHDARTPLAVLVSLADQWEAGDVDADMVTAHIGAMVAEIRAMQGSES